MKKKIFITTFIAIALLINAHAQTWNLGGNAPSATSVLGNTTNQNLSVITNNATRITVKKSGQVGIGTSNPTSVLQVQKSGLSDVLIKSTAGDANLLIDRPGNGMEAVTKYMTTSVPQWKTGLTVNALGTYDFVINNQMLASDAIGIGAATNNVGIGTADFTRAKFTVKGTEGGTIAMFGEGSSGISLAQNWPGIGYNSYFNNTTWKSMTSGFAGQLSMDPGNGVLYWSSTASAATGSDQALTQQTHFGLTPDGRLILNSSNYTSTLAVKKVATAADAASFQGTTNYSHFAFGTNEDTYIRGGLATSNVIIADLGNNVGIGTGTPAYKLDVCGTMRAKEVRVATGWCDYVFADDYALPSLNDVEAFIKANKHLPDVTPGSVIEGEGLEVGKTSAQMIKKIEELTLYVIDLQKQVNALKTQK